MATKNDCLFEQNSGANDISHKDDNHNQYSDLSLNQNNKCSILSRVQSCSNKINKDKHYGAFELPNSTVSANNTEGHGKLKAWNKSPDLCLNTFKLDVLNGDIKEKAEKQRKKDDSSSNTSKSTLSFHVAVFENFVEAAGFNTIKKWENKKEIFTAPTFFIQHLQNPFEFPRQENDKVSDPEVSQFRASQQLLRPNKAPMDDKKVPKELFILAKCGTRLKLPLSMVRQCNLLSTVLDVFSDTHTDPLPLPISAACISFIFQYADFFPETLPPYKSPVGRNKLFHENFDLSKHGQHLLQLSMEQLVEVHAAADYLQFDRLLDDIMITIMFQMARSVEKHPHRRYVKVTDKYTTS